MSSEIEENESTEGGLNYLMFPLNTSGIYPPIWRADPAFISTTLKQSSEGKPGQSAGAWREDELNFPADQDFPQTRKILPSWKGGATLTGWKSPLVGGAIRFPHTGDPVFWDQRPLPFIYPRGRSCFRGKVSVHPFPEPNNTLEGVDIHAFRWEEAVSYQVFTDYTTDYPYPHPTPFHDSDQSVECSGLAFQKVGRHWRRHDRAV